MLLPKYMLTAADMDQTKILPSSQFINRKESEFDSENSKPFKNYCKEIYEDGKLLRINLNTVGSSKA